MTLICQVSITYLQYLLECQVPQSMALFLVLTGKSYQVWKLGALLMGGKKVYVCNKLKVCIIIQSHHFVFRGKDMWDKADGSG